MIGNRLPVFVPGPGGGGGSFVWTTSNNSFFNESQIDSQPLLAAGGGGGGCRFGGRDAEATIVEMDRALDEPAVAHA